jgi:hypothetical protein
MDSDYYTSSDGGESRWLELDDGSEFVTEVHEESFTFLWSSDLRAGEWLDRVWPMLPEAPGTAVLLGAMEQNPIQVAVKSLSDHFAEVEDALQFMRLDYEDRVLSWQTQTERFGETALLAGVLDKDYVVDCLMRTGAGLVAETARDLVLESMPLLERFPFGRLEGR